MNLEQLKTKYTQAKAKYDQDIHTFQNLQHNLISAEGALNTLAELIREAEKSEEDWTLQ